MSTPKCPLSGSGLLATGTSFPTEQRPSFQEGPVSRGVELSPSRCSRHSGILLDIELNDLVSLREADARSLFVAVQHMKKEVELSYLAQEAIALDRMSPYAW